MNRARVVLVLGCVFAASIGLSTVHPWGNPRSGVQPAVPLLQGSNAPENVRITLEAKCGNCHSQRTRYPVYSHLAPISWMIERDVREGRSVFDMSRWQDYTPASRVSLLTRIGSESRSGEMPLKPYLVLHPGDRLNADERQLIYDWAKAERKRIRQQLIGQSEMPGLDSKMERP